MCSRPTQVRHYFFDLQTTFESGIAHVHFPLSLLAVSEGMVLEEKLFSINMFWGLRRVWSLGGVKSS